MTIVDQNAFYDLSIAGVMYIVYDSPVGLYDGLITTLFVHNINNTYANTRRNSAIVAFRR